MKNPLVSVVIPTYNGKEHVGQAIQSILDQSYANFEIIIVDDVSPEDVSGVIDGFADARIKYIRHEKNQGAVAARKTGVHASSGDIIAFLDQDDLFHKQKLQAHVEYLSGDSEIGLSYNGRFEVLGSEKEICGIYKPPTSLTLADWVLGFPVSPSDAVLKRKWALMDEIWDDSFAHQAEHVIFNGQEIVFGGRLALAGCKFGYINRAFNYRRYHPYRVLKHLVERCQAELACQEIIFSDPRCPEDVKLLRDIAFSNIYIMWAYTAYIQEEFDLGSNFLKQALRLNPAHFAGAPSEFLNSWLLWISAGTVDHVRGQEDILRSIFENLPRELEHLKSKLEWAVARSYLLKGLHTLIWGRAEIAEALIQTAIEKGADLDAVAMNMLSDELLNYENEIGGATDQTVIDQLSRLMSRFGRWDSARFLTGFYAINRAFRNFHAGRYDPVPGDVLRAVRADLKYLLDKGMWSVFIRSLLRLSRRSMAHSA